MDLLDPKYWSNVNGGAESNVTNILAKDAKLRLNEFFLMNFVEEITGFKFICLSIE